MNIQTCDHKTFQERAYKAESELENVTKHILTDALKREIDIAKAKGNVDADGCVCLTVIIDGSWNKRSFGHGYSASTGVAVIIGAETGEILYIGSRHSRCKACQYGNTEHKCYCDWNAPPGKIFLLLYDKAFLILFLSYPAV